MRQETDRNRDNGTLNGQYHLKREAAVEDGLTVGKVNHIEFAKNNFGMCKSTSNKSLCFSCAVSEAHGGGGGGVWWREGGW